MFNTEKEVVMTNAEARKETELRKEEAEHCRNSSVYRTIYLDPRIRTHVSIRFPTKGYTVERLNRPQVTINYGVMVSPSRIPFQEFAAFIRYFKYILGEIHVTRKIGAEGHKFNGFKIHPDGKLTYGENNVNRTLISGGVPLQVSEKDRIDYLLKWGGEVVERFEAIMDVQEGRKTTGYDANICDQDYHVFNLVNTDHPNYSGYIGLNLKNDNKFLSLFVCNNHINFRMVDKEDIKVVSNTLLEIIKGVSMMIKDKEAVAELRDNSALQYNLKDLSGEDSNTDYVLVKRGTDGEIWVSINSENCVSFYSKMIFKYNETLFNGIKEGLSAVIDILSEQK